MATARKQACIADTGESPQIETRDVDDAGGGRNLRDGRPALFYAEHLTRSTAISGTLTTSPRSYFAQA